MTRGLGQGNSRRPRSPTQKRPPKKNGNRHRGWPVSVKRLHLDAARAAPWFNVYNNTFYEEFHPEIQKLIIKKAFP
jgi:hypothetical protein